MKNYKKRLNEIYNEKSEPLFSRDSWKDWQELVDTSSTIKRFMKRFGIGAKLKVFRQEKGAVGKTREILQQILMDEERISIHDVKSRLKQEIQKFGGGKPNFSDYEIERVARTEAKSMKIVEKLLRWKQMGFSTVRHHTFVSENSGEKDVDFNNKTFEIDYLLTHPEDRAPLHPNCRCTYNLEK